MKFYMGQDGVQAGNPEKAAELYIKVAKTRNPYENLPMGSDSCEGIKKICENTVEVMNEMKNIAVTTDF